MKISNLFFLLKWVSLVCFLSIIGCASPNLYSINMYYDVEKTVIPEYFKADNNSNAIISVAEFNDTRQIDDRLVMGRITETDGSKVLLLPKSVKATKAVANGIKEYLRKAGYKVPNKIEQWDLKEQNIPQGVANIIIGGSIEDLDISCVKGFPTNFCRTNVKLIFVFADITKNKIFYESRVESNYSKEYALFSEEALGEQAGIALGDAIEKLFTEKVVGQKIKDTIGH
ncbi:hypothetical protein SMITH_223 [Smithella sp. ME-1]|uniref:Lipoprotein n=1 Tax=hydrocarbon metagenome TaxID=938273 RepID=A0A0W8FNM6_9ZZZZ|nr:hypothetical protein SMITH_223 [Smithella sp. ME-1]